MPEPDRARTSWARELMVPALMIGGIGLYLSDSMHLSTSALILPIALIVVIVAALLFALASAFRGQARAKAARAMGEGDDETLGPVLNAKPWLLVALPVLAVALLNYLGALVALVALIFGAQLVFSLKSPLKSLLIAAVITVPVYALFKYVLYVRFPLGALGLG